MKGTTSSALLSALLAADLTQALPPHLVKRDVDTRFPYTGPAVPVGDWADQTVKGNGKGFPRLIEDPAVIPATKDATNNINVIQVSYIPNGVNVHYSTPFTIGETPMVMWGTSKSALSNKAMGTTSTYDRTPPCSQVSVTQCNQFFHEIQISGLKPNTEYYYSIPAAGGTTASEVMSFKTAREAGDMSEYSIAVLNDMGYTNARGTHKYLQQAVEDGISFAWHGGDISYADDWFSGILPCTSDWPVCYNGSETELPGGPPYNPLYLNHALPESEVPDQGGPYGGDMNVIYESNWDLWQNWMNAITTKTPYMALPGNHEAACAEFDGGKGQLAAYLNEGKVNSTSKGDLTYYSCPPSQRNFTTYQHRFRMPGEESGGVGNFWYSFDYGMAHFVSLDSETDYPNCPEYPFIAETDGKTNMPAENETYVTDSGPFGYIKGNYTENESYEQFQWLKNDLAKVDRKKTPWIIAMGHRPMYSSQRSSYQKNLRDAFEAVLVEHGVDMYLAGHIHWYERIRPMMVGGTIDYDSIVNHNTYKASPGKSMVHVVNGMAGNIESHSTLGDQHRLALTAVLNKHDYGFSKIIFNSANKLTWQYIMGKNGEVGDEFVLTKE